MAGRPRRPIKVDDGERQLDLSSVKPAKGKDCPVVLSLEMMERIRAIQPLVEHKLHQHRGMSTRALVQYLVGEMVVRWERVKRREEARVKREPPADG